MFEEFVNSEKNLTLFLHLYNAEILNLAKYESILE